MHLKKEKIVEVINIFVGYFTNENWKYSQHITCNYFKNFYFNFNTDYSSKNKCIAKYQNIPFQVYINQFMYYK